MNVKSLIILGPADTIWYPINLFSIAEVSNNKSTELNPMALSRKPH
jgi:hypothetical protein